MWRRKLWRLTLLFAGGALLGMAPFNQAWASRGRGYHHHHHAVVVGGPAAPPVRGALVEDADSGQVLYAYNADMAVAAGLDGQDDDAAGGGGPD